MRKSLKKMQLKKRSISTLNATEVKGGVTTTTSVITITCKSFIYQGEDNCVSNQR